MKDVRTENFLNRGAWKYVGALPVHEPSSPGPVGFAAL